LCGAFHSLASRKKRIGETWNTFVEEEEEEEEVDLVIQYGKRWSKTSFHEVEG
jgi:hypothetical protein